MTGYVIYYNVTDDAGSGSSEVFLLPDMSLSMMVEANATSATITGLTIGTYFVVMMATSNTLPSNMTRVHTLTIGKVRCDIFSNTDTFALRI